MTGPGSGVAAAARTVIASVVALSAVRPGVQLVGCAILPGCTAVGCTTGCSTKCSTGCSTRGVRTVQPMPGRRRLTVQCPPRSTPRRTVAGRLGPATCRTGWRPLAAPQPPTRHAPRHPIQARITGHSAAHHSRDEHHPKITPAHHSTIININTTDHQHSTFTSTTTPLHHEQSPQHHTKYLLPKINLSTHLFITIRRSGACAPSSADALVPVIFELILSRVSILWGWGAC